MRRRADDSHPVFPLQPFLPELRAFAVNLGVVQADVRGGRPESMT
jgi:hypothetical protein